MLKNNKLSKKTRMNGFFWILPAFLFLVVIIYYSIFYTFNLSTIEWDGLSPIMERVGFDNFVKMFQDKVFWKCIQNTVLYFAITFKTHAGKFPDNYSHQHKQCRIWFRQPIHRNRNTRFCKERLQHSLRRKHQPEYGSHRRRRQNGRNEDQAFMYCRQFNIRMQDRGENKSKKILDNKRNGKIKNRILNTLPKHLILKHFHESCKGTTVSLAMLGVIGALKTFDIPYLITTGGPNHATEFLGTYIYRQGIRQSHLGYAAALSVMLLVMAVVGAFLTNRANKGGA